MNMKRWAGIAVAGCAASAALAGGVGDVGSFIDQPRLFNDFPNSNLTFESNFSPAGSSLMLHEDTYGTGGFANRHAAWFGDAGGASKVDFDYGDAWDMQMTMQINEASNVGQIEAGFQADLFGFGLFGVLTGNGEIAAFGSVLPFHTFGTGLYNIGDEVMLRMIHTPGDGENSAGAPSTMEYMYNNLTTGSGWVSSGLIDFTTTEGGIPSSFDMFTGIGAQINNPAADAVVDISFTGVTVPAPAAAGLLAIGGLGATRRRR
jgi:MYXO-CTERM domain-containing protein